MATDIARTFFSHLSSNGVILTRDMLSTIWLTYLRHARESVGIYESYAKIYSNAISFTGLSAEEAGKAKQRQFSEPLKGDEWALPIRPDNPAFAHYYALFVILYENISSP